VSFGGPHALESALRLARQPTLAPAIRRQTLPPNVIDLIRIAAGCEKTTAEAAKRTGLPSAVIMEASTLYLRTVLFAPQSDSHRTLGVHRGASRMEMRQHMRWLLRWLHPDRNPNEWEAIYAERVIRAWRDVGKGPSQNGSAAQRVYARTSKRAAERLRLGTNRWIALPLSPSNRISRRRLALFMLAAALMIAISSLPPLAH